jgi:hypothetical protein
VRSVDVLARLVHDDLRLPAGYWLEFIEHRVGKNWRQLYEAPREQIKAVPQALVHSGPFEGWRVRVGELADVLNRLADACSSVATSVTSRVWNDAGYHVGHLALMNLHPVGFDDVYEISEAVKLVVEGRSGYLLSSGRYFHYYGRQFLSIPDWPRFLSQFLMPCVLVSPRYIGHSLYRGFCALRLNAAPPAKPVVPSIIAPDDRP